MRISMILTGFVAFSVMACGGSSDGGGEKGDKSNNGAGTGSPVIETDIPGDTEGSSLTEEQLKELCDATAAAAESAFSDANLKAMMCGFTAYLQATLLQSNDKCGEFYDTCMKAPDENMNEPSGQSCFQPSANCKATVDELKQCWTDLFTQTKAAFESLPSCDDVGKEPSEPPLSSGTPSSCKVIEEKCPEVLDDIETPELPGGVTPGAPSAG